MRIVDEPAIRPAHCAVLPHIAGRRPGQWIDTGSEMPGFDNHVYISALAVGELCKQLGWPTPEQYNGVRLERDVLSERLATVEARLAEAEAFIAALDVIESEGFRARKKPGRPRQTEQTAA